ncbi:unnamed protein product [Blepharisma stoltei]|uniref:Taste receptor type 2 n=1 Tax=Blepharisma stoltei TaxID=1481888 RepID=A0AAU9K0A0_9CILI|nr:unnamed protein product [Blepharisma stoltei]
MHESDNLGNCLGLLAQLHHSSKEVFPGVSIPNSLSGVFGSEISIFLLSLLSCKMVIMKLMNKSSIFSLLNALVFINCVLYLLLIASISEAETFLLTKSLLFPTKIFLKSLGFRSAALSLSFMLTKFIIFSSEEIDFELVKSNINISPFIWCSWYSSSSLVFLSKIRLFSIIQLKIRQISESWRLGSIKGGKSIGNKSSSSKSTNLLWVSSILISTNFLKVVIFSVGLWIWEKSWLINLDTMLVFPTKELPISAILTISGFSIFYVKKKPSTLDLKGDISLRFKF